MMVIYISYNSLSIVALSYNNGTEKLKNKTLPVKTNQNV